MSVIIWGNGHTLMYIKINKPMFTGVFPDVHIMQMCAKIHVDMPQYLLLTIEVRDVHMAYMQIYIYITHTIWTPT